ncbi:oligosaccharide flippase family protein [Thermodesulfatator indicus]|uniref:oligosaccharide flippase family protein n=1 Tax=Thermodesulfatator indicus TaxID=171695 RepID=UPI00145E76F2|nr:oligosaccharide flippase family protein [Thermodesulfatator indicus]
MLIGTKLKNRERKFLKETFWYSLTTISFQFSRFFCFFVAAKILGPKQYGWWSLLSLFLLYRGITHFGVIPAMNREIPFFIGKKDFDRVNKIRSVTFSYLLVFSFLSVVVFLFSVLLIKDRLLKCALISMVILFFATQLYHYFQVYLKSSIQFKIMSLQQMLFSVSLPLIVIPLTIKYKLLGFILGQALVIFVICLYIKKKICFRPVIDFDKKELIRLIKIGFPIMLVALFYGLFTSADRWIISAYMDSESLGFYSLGLLVGNSLFLLPRSLAEQIYPRMVKSFGEYGNLRILVILKFKQLFLSLVIVIPLAILICIFFPIVVEIFLPSYLPSIEVIKIIVVGFVFLTIANSFGVFLLSINKQIIYLFVTLFSVVLNIILSIMFVKFGYGIVGVALGSAISYLIFSFCSFIAIIFILKKYGGENAA